MGDGARARPRGPSPLASACEPAGAPWLAAFPADVRSDALADILEARTTALAAAPEVLAMLEAEPTLSDDQHRVLLERLVLCGRLEDAAARVAKRMSPASGAGRAWLAFLQGRTPEAIETYASALQADRKARGKRTGFFPDRPGLFFLVALLASGSAASLARATELATSAQRTPGLAFQDTFAVFCELLDLLTARSEARDLTYLGQPHDLRASDPIEVLLPDRCRSSGEDVAVGTPAVGDEDSAGVADASRPLEEVSPLLERDEKGVLEAVTLLGELRERPRSVLRRAGTLAAAPLAALGHRARTEDRHELRRTASRPRSSRR